MLKSLVKVQRKGAVVIPQSMRQRAGVGEGDLMQIELVRDNQFLITPQLTISRSAVADPKKSRKQILAELAKAVDLVREDAKAKGLDKMPMSEINRAVTAARRDLKKKSKHPAK